MFNQDHNPFEQMTKFWEQFRVNYENWHKSAEEFWTAYTNWLENVFMHKDDTKK